VNLVYHPTLSAGAGESVVAAIRQAKRFILLVAGGVPMAFGGHACIPWSGGSLSLSEAKEAMLCTFGKPSLSMQ
jgi:Ni,Fe-hydrogenase I small subunit